MGKMELCKSEHTHTHTHTHTLVYKASAPHRIYSVPYNTQVSEAGVLVLSDSTQSITYQYSDSVSDVDLILTHEIPLLLEIG